MGNYSTSFEQLSRISIRIRAKTKEKGAKLKVFWLIAGLLLISAYMTGVMPGGIQW